MPIHFLYGIDKNKFLEEKPPWDPWMIPVANHGRKTGNPESGLLRHVLFLVFTIPFRLSTVAHFYMFHVVFLIVRYNANSKLTSRSVCQSGCRSKCIWIKRQPSTRGARRPKPWVADQPDDHLAGSHGMDKVSLQMMCARRVEEAGRLIRTSPIWSDISADLRIELQRSLC